MKHNQFGNRREVCPFSPIHSFLQYVPPQPRVFKVRFYLAFFYFEMNYLSSKSYTSKK